MRNIFQQSSHGIFIVVLIRIRIDLAYTDPGLLLHGVKYKNFL
jgi:hypothetical protein